MADKYVTRVDVDINGAPMEDFKEFREGEREVRRVAELMNKTGSAAVTPRHRFSLVYVVPKTGTEYDFDALEDATVSVVKDGGGRIVYGGVDCLTIGETTYDDENEATRQIDFVGRSRKVS